MSPFSSFIPSFHHPQLIERWAPLFKNYVKKAQDHLDCLSAFEEHFLEQEKHWPAMIKVRTHTIYLSLSLSLSVFLSVSLSLCVHVCVFSKVKKRHEVFIKALIVCLICSLESGIIIEPGSLQRVLTVFSAL